MHKPRNIIFIFSFLALFVAGSAHAQLGTVPDPIQYVITPETPGPNQKVTLQVQGVGTYLGDATITWTQDGKTVLTGPGESVYSFTTGALGTQSRVTVRVVSSSQGTISHTFTIIPTLISLVWEADTSVPPLFRGKALYSGGSNIKVVAFPTVFANGGRMAASVFSYQWSLNDEIVPVQSGIGKNTFSFTGSQLQNAEKVSVQVLYGTTKVGYGEVTIPATQPGMLFYTHDSLRGTLYDVALPSAISLSSREFTIKATPFYFANSSFKNKSVVYKWLLNGEESSGPESANGILTLRQTGSGQGSAVVSAELQNTESDKFVQAASAAIQIVFGQASSGSLFGL